MLFTMIEKDFRTRATRPRWPHHPEIIVGGNANDTVIRQTCHFLPDVGGFVIGVVDGHQQPILGDVQFAGDQFPCKWDRVVFKIIAERKIAQHFEKGVVTGGIADIVQIIMFAACAHTFLCRCGAFVIAGFDPCEQVFELNHTRICKHQRWIVAWHQRAGWYNFMALLGKVIQKG